MRWSTTCPSGEAWTKRCACWMLCNSTKSMATSVPANWHEGEEAMKPTAEGVATYLAKHAASDLSVTEIV